jgi:hypothetical protein
MGLVISSSETGLEGALFSLPILGCLVQPLDEEKLMGLIRKAWNCHHTLDTIHGCREQLTAWEKDLSDIENSLKCGPRFSPNVAVDSFLSLTFRNIVQAMADVRHVTKSMIKNDIEPEACHLFNCSRLMELTCILQDTVDVLEKTKHSFKSRELGILRQKLEQVIHGEKNENSNKVETKTDDI